MSLTRQLARDVYGRSFLCHVILLLQFAQDGRNGQARRQ
jgi:hypothetical protein